MRQVLRAFLSNHVLANLLFVLVIVMGIMSYASMPREQDPSINFNWISVTTTLPGASAEDVEKLVTDKLEEVLNKLQDVRFVSSNSRESVSTILVRFNDLDTDTFDKRVNDLRREIQNKEDELPEEADTPNILEITSANAFPQALLVVVGEADDENLRLQAKSIKDDLERFDGVDRIEYYGLHDPELQISFYPEKLSNLNINPLDIANSVQSHFQDVSAGTTNVGTQKWLIRWLGKNQDPSYMAKLPILNSKNEIQLGEIAKVQRGREKPTRLVNYQGKNAVLLSVMKQANTNTLELVERVKDYIDYKANKTRQIGIDVVLLDDQTEITKNALSVMQNNAALGLLLVLCTTWLFLGFKIAFLVSIGIPFTLAGTFWAIDALGSSLNVSVLLGVVITLGMLVDDAVVVVESIYFRISRGMDNMTAALDALQEVFAPVTTSILTTVAAFAPLMLLPGILGQFMMVIPMVVTIALLISLIEAYWMLPAHIAPIKLNLEKPGRIQKMRVTITHALRVKYTKILIKFMRHPKLAFISLIVLFSLAIFTVATGLIKVNFFANDPLRLFYINIEMPTGTDLEQTLENTIVIENKALKHLKEFETRSVTAYAGLSFSETEPFFGDQYGQIAISLKPETKKMRHIDDVISEMRDDILNTAGPANISFLRLAGGPPTSKPINIKVRGSKYDEIRKATKLLTDKLKATENVFDISNDDSLGRTELVLKPNHDAIYRAGLDPMSISRIVRLLVDGEVITDFQHLGEKVDVRVRAVPRNYTGVHDVLQQTIKINNKAVRLSELVTANTQPSLSNIRHYDFRRTITLFADIDKTKLDTVTVNNMMKDFWAENSVKFPDVDLNFSGELDDIEESLDAMPRLFLLGIGIIYLILGTQFKSYFQPLMILATIPLAFTGVIFGLLITQNPLSLYTLYGIVALSGITVNTSIVLISAANQRLAQGMTLEHAIIFAARRRLIPVLITSLTTIAGLFSLAAGLGGKSLLWGPVATSIVWGLMFSTTLTLIFIPILYRIVMPSET